MKQTLASSYAEPRPSASLRQLFARHKLLAMVLALALIWLFFWHQTGGTFLRPNSISNLFLQMSVTGMLACGMVLVIIAGEIDLSVGSLLGLLRPGRHPDGEPGLEHLAGGGRRAGRRRRVGPGQRLPHDAAARAVLHRRPGRHAGLSRTAAAEHGQRHHRPVPDDLGAIAQAFVPPALSWLMVALIIALACGLALSRRRQRRRLGLALAPAWADGLKVGAIAATAAGFVLVLNQAHGVPLPVLILLALLGVFSWITSQTVFGRHVYAVGGNVEASRLSGVNVKRVKLMVFMLMGLMCAFAGIVTTARAAAGSPSAGVGGELDAIAACFIGGTSMRGGSGTVYGALIGALVMASLDNGMQQMNVDTSWQMIVKGAVLVLAVWIDVATRSERA